MIKVCRTITVKVRAFSKSIVKNNGVGPAETGEKARQKYFEEEYNLVLLDVMPPGGHGVALSQITLVP